MGNGWNKRIRQLYCVYLFMGSSPYQYVNDAYYYLSLWSCTITSHWYYAVTNSYHTAINTDGLEIVSSWWCWDKDMTFPTLGIRNWLAKVTVESIEIQQKERYLRLTLICFHRENTWEHFTDFGPSSLVFHKKAMWPPKVQAAFLQCIGCCWDNTFAGDDVRPNYGHKDRIL